MTEAQSQVSDEFFLRRNGDNYSFHYKGGHRPATDAEIYFWQQYQDSKRVQPPEVSEEEVFEVVMSANEWNSGGMVLPENARRIIRALRANFAISRRVGG